MLFARTPELQYGIDMENNREWWRFFDGSVSVSAAMLVAVLISKCAQCDEWLILGLLKSLTNEDSGIIIVATLLLFPTTLALFGGLKLYFAAKEAYERRKRARLKEEEANRKRAKAEGRKQGVAEGRMEGRMEIRAELEKRGMLTPEIAEMFEEKGDE